MQRLLEASQRALNTLKVINAITPNPQIEGAIEELEFAINEVRPTQRAADGSVCTCQVNAADFHGNCMRCGLPTTPRR